MKYILTNTTKAIVDAASAALDHAILGHLDDETIYLKSTSASRNPKFQLYCDGNTVELEYEEGMTFEDWVASDYNNNDNLELYYNAEGSSYIPVIGQYDYVCCCYHGSINIHRENADGYLAIKNMSTNTYAKVTDTILSVLYSDIDSLLFT